jgi:hypothetical protein
MDQSGNGLVGRVDLTINCFLKVGRKDLYLKGRGFSRAARGKKSGL